MQDLQDVRFKSGNVLSRLSLSKIPSETKEYVAGYWKSIETEWALSYFKLFFFIFTE